MMTATPGSARWPGGVVFAYSPTEKVALGPILRVSGVLQADAYAGSTELYRDGRITEAACWVTPAVKSTM